MCNFQQKIFTHVYLLYMPVARVQHYHHFGEKSFAKNSFPTFNPDEMKGFERHRHGNPFQGFRNEADGLW